MNSSWVVFVCEKVIDEVAALRVYDIMVSAQHAGVAIVEPIKPSMNIQNALLQAMNEIIQTAQQATTRREKRTTQGPLHATKVNPESPA